MTGGPSQRVLQAAATTLGRVALASLQERTSLKEFQVHDSVIVLVRCGFLLRRTRGYVSITPAGLKHLEAGQAIKSGPKGPRPMDGTPGSLRSRIWKALRMLRKASVVELLSLAARGEEGNAWDNAKTYLNALTRAGYVTRMNRKGERVVINGNAPTRYFLLRDTGPRAPQYNRHQKRVFDPNTLEVFDVA